MMQATTMLENTEMRSRGEKMALATQRCIDGVLGGRRWPDLHTSSIRDCGLVVSSLPANFPVKLEPCMYGGGSVSSALAMCKLIQENRAIQGDVSSFQSSRTIFSSTLQFIFCG